MPHDQQQITEAIAWLQSEQERLQQEQATLNAQLQEQLIAVALEQSEESVELLEQTDSVLRDVSINLSTLPFYQAIETLQSRLTEAA